MNKKERIVWIILYILIALVIMFGLFLWYQWILTQNQIANILIEQNKLGIQANLNQLELMGGA